MIAAGLAATSVYAIDPGAQDAYNAGIDAGQQAFNPNLATDGSALGAQVPNFDPNPPPSTGYNGNNPNAAIAAGQSEAQTSDTAQMANESFRAAEQEQSLANGTDPIYQQSAPQSALAALYPGCTDAVSTTSVLDHSETCNATPPIESQSCNNTLQVDVTYTDHCESNSILGAPAAVFYWRAGGGLRVCRLTATVYCGPEMNGVHHMVLDMSGSWGTGQRTIDVDPRTPGVMWNGIIAGCGGTVTSNGCDANNNCSMNVTVATTSTLFNFPLAVIQTNINDSWANACAVLEARVQP